MACNAIYIALFYFPFSLFYCLTVFWTLSIFIYKYQWVRWYKLLSHSFTYWHDLVESDSVLWRVLISNAERIIVFIELFFKLWWDKVICFRIWKTLGIRKGLDRMALVLLRLDWAIGSLETNGKRLGKE